jgi:hypothetical protein
MAPTSTPFIGRSVKPYKSKRFVTGNGTYVADVQLPHMLHAALLRSLHAHARLGAIEVKEALAINGVAGVWTGRDIQGRISAFPESFEIHPLPWLEAVKPVLRGPRPTALAQGKVHYVGEPVAIAVAEDRHRAEDAVETIAVEYAPLPVVVDPEASLQPGATLVHDGSGDNVVFGGQVAVRQFARIGEGAMIVGMSGVRADVIPWGLAFGHLADLVGLNVVGMKRRGIARADIHALRDAYESLFFGPGQFRERFERMAGSASHPLVKQMVDFIRAGKSRPLTMAIRRSGGGEEI